jgi:hypothetical protein
MSKPDSQRGQSEGRAPGVLLSPFLWTVLVVGVLVHLAGFLVFQIVSQPLPDNKNEAPLLEYLSERAFSGEVELEEQAILFDSAPLFVPTRWSASSGLFTAQRADQWVFPEYEPEIKLLEDLEPVALVVDSVDDVVAPEDLLDSRYWEFFTGFARGGESPISLTSSGPIAEIQVLSTQQITKQSVRLVMESTSPLAGRPAHFYLRVDATGRMLSRPRLAESSGVDDFDQAVRQWLQSSVLAADLPVGYLSIRVFP